MAKSKIIDFF